MRCISTNKYNSATRATRLQYPIIQQKDVARVLQHSYFSATLA